MPEYIEREATLASINNVLREKEGEKDSLAYFALSLFAETLKKAPAVDVVEVKHGEWERTEEPLGWQDVTLAKCSVCGEGWLTDDNFSIEEFVDYWHYCPNCGAKMDLKERK